MVGCSANAAVPPDDARDLREALGALLAEIAASVPHTGLLVLVPFGGPDRGFIADAVRAAGADVVECGADEGADDRTALGRFSQLQIVLGPGPFPNDASRGPQFRIGPRNATGGTGAAFAVERRYPRRYSGDRHAQQDFEAALKRLDRYNADLAQAPDDPSDPPGLAGLMARTDRAANALQRRALSQLRLLYGIAFVAIAAQLGFGGTIGQAPIKSITLALAFLAYRIVRSGDFENRYQDYRAVAEGLRVQRAWNAAGLGGETVDASYLRMQQSELQWIRMALRSAAFAESRAPAPAEPAAVRAWIREQWRYYRRAASRGQRIGKVFGKFGKAAQYVGIGTTVIAMLLLFGPLRTSVGPALTAVQQWVTASAALIGALAALVGSYADKRGFSANAKRYDRMFGVFDPALRELHRQRDPSRDDVARIARDVGREALAEQADWLLARRDRPLRMVNK